MNKKPETLQAVTHRCDSKGRHFLWIPKGFWGPLVQLMGIPFLADTACGLLQEQKIRKFVVRASSLAHAQDSAARLLPLVLGYNDSGDLLELCTCPKQVLAATKAYLDDFPGEGTMVEYADQQVHLCRTLPVIEGDCALLVPEVPEECSLPVLIQQRDLLPLDQETLACLEQCRGPVILLQDSSDAPVPDGWPVWTVPDADPDWFSRLLFRICRNKFAYGFSMTDAKTVAYGLCERFGSALSEQDLRLAATFVRNSEGNECVVSAQRFLDLVNRMPIRDSEEGLSCLTTMMFRQTQAIPYWKFNSPLMIVGALKYLAQKCPAPYPHEDAPPLACLNEKRTIINRMMYDPTVALGLRDGVVTALVAESCGDLYGMQLQETVSYADLFKEVRQINKSHQNLDYWVLVVNCDPRVIEMEDVRYADYAFHFTADAVTLYDGVEGLQEFSRAAKEFLLIKLREKR